MKLVNNILRKAGFIPTRDHSRAVKYAERNAYKAAVINRLTSDFIGTSNSINRELRSDLTKVRSRARELWRNDDYIQAYKHNLKSNVVGPAGFILQSKVKNDDGTEDKYANDVIEKAWKKWCRKENCTMSGQFNFITVQQLAIQHLERDGEFVARLVTGIDQKENPFGFSLELIEPDYLDETYNETLQNGNVVVMGVEINEWKKPVAFYFKKRDPRYEIYGNNFSSGKTFIQRVPADEIVFIIDPEHCNQVRGVSALASTLITHHHLNGYIEAHVVAARGGANKMLFIQKPVDAVDTEFEGDEVDSEGNKLEYMSPGQTEYLNPGETANMIDPSYPQGEFWSFIKAMLRKLFAGRGVDYNSTSGDLEGVSYSSMRSGKENERNTWMMKQQMMLDYFCIPIFETFLKWTLLYGQVNLPYSKFDKFNQPDFIPKRWAYFDPEKDIRAAVMAINNGLSTRRRELAKVGEDYHETIITLSEEMKEAEKLNIKYGDPKDGLEIINEADAQSSSKADNGTDAGSGSGNSGRNKEDGGVLSLIRIPG